MHGCARFRNFQQNDMSESRLPQPGETYRHYSGNHYEVVGIAFNSEDITKRDVVYKSIEPSAYKIVNSCIELKVGTLWHRPLEAFCEILENGKPRFTLVRPRFTLVRFVK